MTYKVGDIVYHIERGKAGMVYAVSEVDGVKCVEVPVREGRTTLRNVWPYADIHMADMKEPSET